MDAPTIDLLLSPAGLGILGLCIGSFLNVVIHRLPLMLERQWWADAAQQVADAGSWRRVFAADPPAPLHPAGEAMNKALLSLAAFGLMRPRSRCPHCGHAIRAHENIPVIGWLALRGRCSSCGGRISARYPLVELITGALFAAIGWRFGAQPAALLWCALAATLVALAVIDWDTTVLPDVLNLPLLWAGLVAALLGWSGVSLAASVQGALAGYLSLWSVYWLFKLATGKEGMGYGDFKLLAALGAWLGWQAILPIVLFASVFGALVGIAMKLAATLREGRYVPFGPFLAAGGIAVMLVGVPTVMQWIGWA